MMSMDSLGDLLKGRTPQEPPEVAAAKRYIFEHFATGSSVTLQPNALVITVASASLASTLRMQLPKLQAACGTDKQIIFRIG
jgi:hypothetical protein